MTRFYYAGQTGSGTITIDREGSVVTDHEGPGEPVTGPLIVEWVEDRVTDSVLAAALALGEQHYGKCHGIFPMVAP